MTNPEESAPKKTEGKAPEGAEGGGKRGWLPWAVGWVLVPATLVGLIFGGGALVGVHLHDSWLARLVVWFVELFW